MKNITKKAEFYEKSNKKKNNLDWRPTRGWKKCCFKKDWIKKNKLKIVDVVCNNENVIKCSLSKDRTYGKVLLATAIADLLGSILTGVSPFTVAVLLVKEGLESFCDEHWNQKK